MPQIIGLTGGIASGKSTVANMFRDKNIPVVDADIVAREVVEIGTNTYKQLVETFGNEILNSDRSLNRPKLGSIIFQDEEKRKQLNNIMHPAIRSKMKEQTKQYIEKGHETVVMDIPLLFESKLTHLVDKIVLVFVNEKTQLKRLMNRNELSEKEAVDRISSQMPLKDKVALSHAIIDNNDTLSYTKQQLEEILQEWHIPN
ncbi:dephospho-CoA kinase [Sutcliffiella rhizosphaerae]|uniref:Dephospho-CoA kinase n=1 Tax=Sutcliffiella rhizosphaerae TaxID=2880967 RepID=A0ABM8YI82_9BACI|nr:dephospho-CoA kinase [Sutcliffiella rhizosphaerae]CAG9619595.1 Dephospho-CoA kinase [Sutcliffiella rhizosphaerae]